MNKLLPFSKPTALSGRFGSLHGENLELDAVRSKDRLMAELRTQAFSLPCEAGEASVAQVAAAFLEFADGHYRTPCGDRSSGYQKPKSALQWLTYLYGDTRAQDFNPRRMRALMQFLISRGVSRSTINDYACALRSVFKWAASYELVPVGVHKLLSTITPLQRGRCDARETAPVRPVPLEHVEAVRPHVSRQVWAAIQLQLKTAARPSEILGLRPRDIDMTDIVWVVSLESHKMARYDRERVLYLGPQAQQVLKPFLRRARDAYIFSPREAEQERYGRCPTHRHQPVNAPATDRRIHDHYTASSYGNAIGYGCIKAGVPHWTPHQLRHTAATAIRRDFGLDVTQAVLGHARASITEIYAEVDRSKAIRVMSRMG